MHIWGKLILGLLRFHASLGMAGGITAPLEMKQMTIYPADLKPQGPLGAGDLLRIADRWSGRTDKDYRVFIHFVNEKGTLVFGGDHSPSPGTASGSLTSDNRRQPIRTDYPPGKYRIWACPSPVTPWRKRPTIPRRPSSCS